MACILYCTYICLTTVPSDDQLDRTMVHAPIDLLLYTECNSTIGCTSVHIQYQDLSLCKPTMGDCAYVYTFIHNCKYIRTSAPQMHMCIRGECDVHVLHIQYVLCVHPFSIMEFFCVQTHNG